MTWQALPWQSSLQAAFTTIWGSGVSPIPSLDLNFTLGSLDPRITYTGASLATLTDATGAIAYKPHNLLTYSEDFTNAAWSKARTTVTANATSDPNGQLTADKLVEQAVSSTHYLAQAGTTTVGTTYTFSIRAKAAERRYIVIGQDGGTGYFEVDLQSGSFTASTVGTYLSRSITAEANGFYKITITYVAANTGATGFIFLGNASGISISYTGDGTSGVYIWGAQLNIGPLQHYYPTTSAAYYGPRFTYDPTTHAALGLLIEEQRTNLLLQSNSLSTTWSTFGSAGISQNITGIDGGTTGWTLTDSNAGGLAGVQQAVALAATTYTLSAYVKKTTGAQASYPVINADNGSTRTCLATIDTSNGVATVWTAYTGWTVTTSSATCVSHNADYWRVTLTFLATAVNWNIGLYAAGTANATQSTGVLSASAQGSAGFTCLQLEAGSFATSYIPTTSASVTRAADSATMTGSNFSSWFNATQGTFVAKFVVPPLVASTYKRVFSARNVADTERLEVWVNGAGTVRIGATTGGATTETSLVAAVTNGQVCQVAMAYTSSTQTASLNGAAVISQSASLNGAAFTVLDIGQYDLANILNATIARLRYYNTALTNAQLQALTT